MKKNIGSIVFLLALLLTAGCAKDVGPFDPNNPVSAPIFTMSAIIGTDSVEMAAGPNGYRMETSKTPLGNLPGHFLLDGNMRDPQCPNCGPSLELKLWHRPNSPQEADPEVAFEAGNVSLGVPVQPSNSRTFQFNFIPQNGLGNPQQVFWDFGDGQTGQGQQATHTYQTTGGTPTIVSVLCTAIYNAGCSVVSVNSIDLSQTDFFNVDLAILGPIVTVNVTPILSPTQGNIFVDMGDGSLPYTDFSFVHQYPGPGTYFMNAFVFTGIDSIFLLQYQRTINIGPPACNGGFTFSEVIDSVLPLPREAEILYNDGNGNSYSSRPILSGSEQFLEIIHHEAYKPDEHGDLVYKLEIEASCWLYEVNGTDSIRMEGALLKWGLPY